MKYNPGIGATDEFKFARECWHTGASRFQTSRDGEWMLALERKATLRKNKVEVKSQPFGGAIRILDLDAIHDLIGDFHFDSDVHASNRISASLFDRQAGLCFGSSVSNTSVVIMIRFSKRIQHVNWWKNLLMR